jgi:integrase
MGITDGQLIKRGKVWHWRYRVDGEQRSQSLKVTSLSEAKRLRQAFIAEYNENPDIFRVEENPSVEDFWEAFESWSRDHKAESTIGYEHRAWWQLVKCARAKKVGDIKRNHVEKLKAQLKRKGASGRPLKDGTINHFLRHLKAIFNQGIELGYFTGVNPVNGVKLYKIPRKNPDYLNQEEIAALLDVAKEHSVNLYRVFVLGIYSGMRKNEIVNARWEWFDFERKLIHIQSTEAFKIKDFEDRDLPMSAKIHKALFPHSEREGYLFHSGRASQGKSKYRYDPVPSVRKIAKTAGVPRANFLLMRHTFGSQHAIAGTSIYKIAKWMGHSSVDVTARHYAGLQDYDEDIDRI